MDVSGWRVEFAGGIVSVDEQNQRQIALLDTFYELIQAGNAHLHAELEQLLGLYHEHAAAGFSHEEQLMRRHGYPLAEEHAAHHGDFLADLEAQRSGFRAGQVAPLALANWIQDWIVVHMVREDKPSGRYVASLNVA